MTKEEYLNELRKALTELNISNVDGQIEFYAEMIDDRIEDGMTEYEAVASMEPIEDIVENTRLERSFPVLVKEKVKQSREKAAKKGLSTLWAVLIVLGFPLWFPILLTLGIVVLTVFLVFGILIFTFYAVEFALAAAAIGCIIAPFKWIGDIASFGTKLGSMGAGLVLVGVCILIWKPLAILCKSALNGLAASIRAIKKLIF